MLMNEGNFGDLGWGWKSFTSAVKRVGQAGYKVASMPVKAALKVANATSSVLCKDGAAAGGNATANSFCRAVKAKDQLTIRRLLPQATAIASTVSKAQQIRAAYRGQPVTAPVAEAETNMLSALYGANPDELSYALAGVDPGEIGAAVTTRDAVVIVPIALAVIVGLRALSRG